MSRTRNLFLVIALVLLIAVPALQAAEVVVEGMGDTREKAMEDARRNAVSTVLGTYVNSESLVNNFQLVSDRILTASHGYVTNTQVLEEGQSHGMYSVKVKATVQEKSIRDDVNAIAVLNAKRGNPRFVVVPDPNPTADQFRPGDPAVGEALRSINAYLAQRQMNVVTGPQFGSNLMTGTPDMLRDLSQYSAGLGAEYAVYFSVIGKDATGSGGGRTFGSMPTGIAIVNISVVHTGSYRIVAQTQAREKEIDRDDLEFAYRKAAKEAAKSAMAEAMDMVLADWSRYGSTAGGTYTVKIHNIDDAKLGEFKSALEQQGVGQVNMRGFENGTATLVVTYDGTVGGLSDVIRRVQSSKNWAWAMTSADTGSLTYQVPEEVQDLPQTNSGGGW
ncbi:hypothetical protein GF324_01340 [bacterium]|nr:hypothetical protein [bacterium]